MCNLNNQVTFRAIKLLDNKKLNDFIAKLLRKNMKTIFIYIIKIYQKFLSPFFFPSCRYYPSCSNYAILLFKFDNPFLAFCKIILRILSCNSLFKGGVHNPSIRIKRIKKIFKLNAILKNQIIKKGHLKYLFVPNVSINYQKFYIIIV